MPSWILVILPLNNVLLSRSYCVSMTSKCMENLRSFNEKKIEVIEFISKSISDMSSIILRSLKIFKNSLSFIPDSGLKSLQQICSVLVEGDVWDKTAVKNNVYVKTEMCAY
ncbi:hypothetical protein AMECASPLE_032400 [Ameca splendens]|uniref:Uncharacterized protein n=1 Tax=Ameca splendens TaxID=208324 RepID=A0ABV1ACY4_9TELE